MFPSGTLSLISVAALIKSNSERHFGVVVLVFSRDLDFFGFLESVSSGDSRRGDEGGVIILTCSWLTQQKGKSLDSNIILDSDWAKVPQIRVYDQSEPEKFTRFCETAMSSIESLYVPQETSKTLYVP